MSEKAASKQKALDEYPAPLPSPSFSCHQPGVDMLAPTQKQKVKPEGGDDDEESGEVEGNEDELESKLQNLEVSRED